MSADDRFISSASGSSVSTRHMGGPCRVCGLAISRDEPALVRPWAIQRAHVACGYLRPEEREPNEFRYPERWGTYWQWACVCCGRDVVNPERRAELRCGLCVREGRPAPASSAAAPPERKVVTFDIPADAVPTVCRSCREPIAWVVTAKGKKMPVELATKESHFARCPEANGWRKPTAPRTTARRRTTRTQNTK